MSRERIKSFVLVSLVMINFILGAKILTDKKLWPYGYNFFISLENSDILHALTGSQDKKTARANITKPEQIIVNTGDQTSRIAINPDDEIFQDIYTVTGDILSDVLKNETKSISFAPKDEWVSVLNGKSVCLNFAIPYDTVLFGEFFGTDASSLSAFVPSLSKIVIADNALVYFEDYKTGDFYKTESTHSFSKLVSIINKSKNLYQNNNSIINYSVDLKFDEAFGSQKAVLSPTVAVYSTPVKMPILTAVNPLVNKNNGFDKEIIEKILSVFKINSNTVRRYPEADGTMVFVENDGILKISPDGVIRYQSTDSDGFSLNSDNTYIDTLTALADFADRLNNACLTDSDLYISQIPSSQNEKVTFDYRANGVPVKTEFKDYKNAVTAEIKNGAMTSYVHVLRKYISGTELYEIPGYIESLDAAIENYSHSMNNIEIQKMYISYIDDGSFSPKPADWKTQVKSIVIEN